MRKTKFLTLALALMCSATAAAYDFLADGIAYDINPDGQTVTVTYKQWMPKPTSEISTVNIPETVTNNGKTYTVTGIGYYAYGEQFGVEHVIIPKTGTQIADMAFRYCYDLKTVTLMGGSPTIGNLAFVYAGGERDLYIYDLYGWCSIKYVHEESAGNYHVPLNGHLYLNDEEILDLVIPSGIETLNNTCAGARYLKSITLPATVKAIKGQTFDGCDRVRDLYCEFADPQQVELVENAFIGINKNECVLHVPHSAKSLYANAEQWKEFKFIEEMPNLEPASITAPELSVNRVDVGRVMQLPLTLHMPQGGDFTQIQIEVSFPEGLHPIMDEDGCYGFAGDDITKKNKVPVVTFTDNMDVDGYWPTYMIVGANVTLTPVTANPCHVYTLNFTADPGYDAGEREFTAYVKYVGSNNKSYTIGLPEDPVTLTTVKFVDSDLLLGDANLDGCVDVDDLNIVLNIILGINTLKINQLYVPRVDMNQNGNVDIDDMNAIINIMLGLGPNWHDSNVTTYNVNGVEFNMVKVEGGTFTMGATAEQSDNASDREFPAHEVTLSDYSIGQTPVTQELWQAVMGSNPSNFVENNGYGDNLQRPVDNVSWNDCQEFIRKLNTLIGKSFRLPTEAEWEYAARGGNKSMGYKYAGGDDINSVAWYIFTSDNIPQTVATKLPNELGLYDMSGNIWEWCNDWYGSYTSSPQTDPTGPTSGSNCVLRGGHFNDYAWYCRVSFRYYYYPSGRGVDLGLRLAM